MVVVVVIYLKSQNHTPRKPNSSDYKKATSVQANVKATTLKAKTKATIPKAKATIPSLRPQPHVAAALPVPDDAQRTNQHLRSSQVLTTSSKTVNSH